MDNPIDYIYGEIKKNKEQQELVSYVFNHYVEINNVPIINESIPIKTRYSIKKCKSKILYI